MNPGQKIEYLIVDTSAFIKNVQLQEVGENIITEPSVVNEITSKRQLKRLVVLPYDLTVKDVFSENIKFVTEFSKKTGDYTSLSATDIRVIALTYQLEKEKVGTEHLKEAPSIAKTLPTHKTQLLAHPKNKDDNKNTESNKLAENDKEDEDDDEEEEDNDDDEEDEDTNDNENIESNDLAEKFKTLDVNIEDLKLEDGDNADDILAPVDQESDDCNEDEEEDDEEEDGDDDDGWITPSNVKEAKKKMNAEFVSEKPVKVACMTTDFAMQNVLKQIGLNVAALDGRVIKQVRTFIFRCYACFATTSIMTNVFCPSCGNKTLKKVAVSIDDKGNQKIHINFNRPLTARGKRFSMPTPKGGKHACNPIRIVDQPMPDQKLSRLAKMKNDPLNDDYIAGYSPFTTRDVNSKSAMLGLRQGRGEFKYWMKKNPNESKKKRK
ncbi:hypothetical protein HCN44_005214 [Aphidius gifuensis]|uniref:RNA-binding protein NOB1 n=1 Tax=Aphidius gifuensis TaxID=684658 RepID=A0A835CU18_APHGI|nr:hypothetical protein HCN44_005214 [Aphidius gifuensis]